MECGCGRSPTGKCIGWHKLSKEEFQEKLKEHEDKDNEEEQILFKYSTTPNYYINSSSTISIASNWNATRSWRDQVDNESDINWYVGYSLSDP